MKLFFACPVAVTVALMFVATTTVVAAAAAANNKADAAVGVVTDPMIHRGSSSLCRTVPNPKGCNGTRGCSWVKISKNSAVKKSKGRCVQALSNANCLSLMKKTCKAKGCVWGGHTTSDSDSIDDKSNNGKNEEEQCNSRWEEKQETKGASWYAMRGSVDL